MNHYVRKVTFGDERHQGMLVATYGGIDHGEHTIFNMFGRK